MFIASALRLEAPCFLPLNSVRSIELDNELQNDYFSVLLDEEPLDGIPHVTLSAMGVLFNERFRLQFAKQENALLSLIPKDDTTSKPIKIKDGEEDKILVEFAYKISKSPYIKGIINSLPFNPRRTNPIRRTYSDGKVEFVMTWTDPGYGLCIQTTARNMAETNTLALYLKEIFFE